MHSPSPAFRVVRIKTPYSSKKTPVALAQKACATKIMRVACGLAWLSLLASATALCHPAVRGHLSCVARVNPATARLGKPTAVIDADGSGPVGWADVTYSHPPLRILEKLDAIEPTLSYPGWQKDVAEIEKSYIKADLKIKEPGPVGQQEENLLRRLDEVRRKQERLQERHDLVQQWLQDLNELKATLSYDGWQEDAAQVEERDCKWTPSDHWDDPDPEQAMDQMRRKQQVHERRLTRPGWPVPLDQIEDDDDDHDDFGTPVSLFTYKGLYIYSDDY